MSHAEIAKTTVSTLTFRILCQRKAFVIGQLFLAQQLKKNFGLLDYWTNQNK